MYVGRRAVAQCNYCLVTLPELRAPSFVLCEITYPWESMHAEYAGRIKTVGRYLVTLPYETLFLAQSRS